MFDDNNNEFDMNQDEDQIPPEGDGGGNRVFLIAIGIIGGIFLLSLIGFAAYALLNVPQRNAQRNTEIAQIYALNTATALAFTQAAEPKGVTPEPSNTSTIPTLTPTIGITSTDTAIPAKGVGTETPVVAALPMETLTQQATMAVLLTRVAVAQQTTIPTLAPTRGAAASAATALPSTGFADEVGLPGLASLAVILIIVIFLVRRLRLPG
jgi:hypothetical protein